MAAETSLTIIGNLIADPDLRYTPSGAAVANFTIASTPRQFDREAGQWSDGDALFLRGTAWAQLAEHTAESLSKGARVIVHGRLRQRSFTTDEGDKRAVLELEVDDIGPSLRFAANIHKPERTDPNNDNGSSAAEATGEGS
jgi:single-strand DNA-binding protein